MSSGWRSTARAVARAGADGAGGLAEGPRGRSSRARRARRGQAPHRRAVDGERAVAGALPGDGGRTTLWLWGGGGDERGHLRVDGLGLRGEARLHRVGAGALIVLRMAHRAAGRQRESGRDGGHACKRGPVPAISDADLLAAIRHDLERSPFTGEGHRKVWARLRSWTRIRVSRKRVLRLMRENGLLSPHRPRPPTEEPHDGNDHHPGAQPHVGHRRR